MKTLSQLLTVLVLMCAITHAQPPQRIIIGFESAIAEEHCAEIKQSIEQLLDRRLQIIEPSNPQRWIIVLDTPLPPDQLQAAIDKIQNLPQVRYAELDSLLHAH